MIVAKSTRISILLAGLIVLASWMPAQSTTPTTGENLYRRGILPSGAPVTGDRESGGSASGESAACVNCHRPSGMGTAEGGTIVPPITARYLFQRGAAFARESNYAERGTRSRSPYTDATLVRAIREGIDPDGRKFDYLMPRYNLDDAAMSSLIAYLKGLSSEAVPGVSLDTLQFATIITPDADPVRRKGMLDVLEHFVAAKNVFYRPIPSPVRFTKMMYHAPRKWQLHVWELTGEPETWGGQLRERLKAEPVFAVISGLGGRNWAPIHRFCREASIPCLFPNLDLPVADEGDFYNVYFSKGVLLEAQLIARKIQGSADAQGIRRVVQVFREDDVGVDAAKALRGQITSHGLEETERPIAGRVEGGRLAAAIGRLDAKDVLILWLRPGDLRELPLEPPKASMVFVSGIMGGLDDVPLKGKWRDSVLMTYPFELPSRRGAMSDYPLAWLKNQRIPLIAKETQVDTYIACNIVSESLRGMLDDFLRDYLLETIEEMLSTRVINGYYPRLSLAPGQRFASKGGYIVRLGRADRNELISEGNWLVP